MGFIASTVQQLKSSFTPKLNWPSMGESVKSAFKREEPAVLLKDSDMDEFKVRYKNLRVTAFISLVFVSIAFFSILLAGNFKDFFYSFCATTLFGMCYFRYAYMLWICRYTLASGEDLNTPVRATAAHFLNAVAANPNSLLPLALPETLPDKGASK